MATLINSTIRRESNKTLFKSIEQAVKGQPWTKVCKPMKTSQITTYFDWLGQHGSVNEFTDNRTLQSLASHTYNVKTKKWEYTLDFEVDSFNENKDMINPKIADMATGVLAPHYNTEFFEKLAAAETNLGPDGIAFFSNSHTIDGSATLNDNLMAITGITEANVIADWLQVKSAYLAFVNRAGIPLFESEGGAKYVIFHGPATYDVMNTVFNNKNLSGGGYNINYGAAETVVSGRLSGNDWYCFRVDMPYSPFYMLEGYKWNAEWDETDKFKSDRIYYGAKGRYICMYGYYQTAIKVT